MIDCSKSHLKWIECPGGIFININHVMWFSHTPDLLMLTLSNGDDVDLRGTYCAKALAVMGVYVLPELPT